MLTILGSRETLDCGGMPRRSFLRIGSLGMGLGALSLADLLRAESASKAPGESAETISSTRRPLSHKAVINIFLAGGPPHQDMWDVKTDAPREIRGEFRPIPTNVSGIEICEVFERLAKVMDKCAIIRSVVGAGGGHDAWQCMTGWKPRDLAVVGGRPSIGSVVTKVQGPVDPSVPTFVGLAEPTSHAPWSDPGSPGFLGPAFTAFKPSGPGIEDMVLHGCTVERLE